MRRLPRGLRAVVCLAALLARPDGPRAEPDNQPSAAVAPPPVGVSPATSSPSLTTGALPPPDERASAELARCFEQSVRDKIRQGYFVRNDGWIKSLANIPNPTLNPLASKKGGRCGEFGGWGMDWIKSCTGNIPGAAVDDIVVEEKSTVRNAEATWSEWRYWNPEKLLWSANHRATRVTMPDGRRFVVDYWDGVSTSTPRMVTEAEWSAKWLKLVGDDLFGPQDAVVALGEEQQTLKAMIGSYGEEKAFDLFRRQKKRYRDFQPDAWINSWKREPW